MNGNTSITALGNLLNKGLVDLGKGNLGKEPIFRAEAVQEAPNDVAAILDRPRAQALVAEKESTEGRDPILQEAGRCCRHVQPPQKPEPRASVAEKLPTRGLPSLHLGWLGRSIGPEGCLLLDLRRGDDFTRSVGKP